MTMIRLSRRAVAPALGLAALLTSAGGALSATTELISVDSGGAQGHGDNPAISGNTRYVAFTSWSPDLVGGDTNGATDIFVHDRRNQKTVRVSVSSGGAQANGSSYAPAISSSGGYIAFESEAGNLVSGDTNGTSDIFVHDRTSSKTSRVSVNSNGRQAGQAYDPAISADGRYVAFKSWDRTLVPDDGNDAADVFVRDRHAGETFRASVDSGGLEGNGHSWGAAISADGRRLVFVSSASNLVPGDTNGRDDVFLHNLQTRRTTRVSVGSAGEQAADGSWGPAISADGKFVAFYSYAANLVPGDTNGYSDVFVRDRQAGQTVRVSMASNGAQANRHSYAPAISGDGALVAFHSYAGNLVPDDTNQRRDVFIHDLHTELTTRLSVRADGKQGNALSGSPSISADGRYVAFHSRASNLVPSDTNGLTDVFVRTGADNPPILEWAGTPGCTVDGVRPNTGRPDATSFTFRVKYRRPRGGPLPTRANCQAWGKAEGEWEQLAVLPLTLESGGTTAGAIYAASLTLPNKVLRYRFDFRASDGPFAIGPPAFFTSGPDIKGPPLLSWSGTNGFTADGVEPNSGPVGTKFAFQVRYMDSAGDAPLLGKLVLNRDGIKHAEKVMEPPDGDLKFKAGVRYTASYRIREPGIYKYRFVFEDAWGRATGEPSVWILGPTIEGDAAAMLSSLTAAPTSLGAEVAFALSAPAHVTATVLNVAGRPVRALCSARPCESGINTLLWNARSDSGLPVPRGVYLIEVAATTPSGARTKSVTQLRISGR